MTRISGNIIAGVTALLMGASTASAMTIPVDVFTDDQFVQDAPGMSVKSSAIMGGMLGGTRFLEVSNNESITAGTQLNSAGGTISFNNASTATGIGFIVYDGTTARGSLTDPGIGVGVDTMGLGGVNLVVGPSISQTFFSFDLSGFDPGATTTALFSAFAYDMSGGSAFFGEVVGSGPIAPDLFLSDFVGIIDWTDIGALAFTIDSTVTSDPIFGDFGGGGFDGQVGAITINAIPLPASVLLMLSGVGALGGAGFLRRKKSHA